MTRISERRPQDLKEFWNFREDLSIENGVIFLWAALRNSHVSTEKCLLKAKESLFLPGVSRDIKELTANCATCMQSPKQETRGVLSYPRPKLGWDFVHNTFTLQTKLSKTRTRFKVKLTLVTSFLVPRKYRKSG